MKIILSIFFCYVYLTFNTTAQPLQKSIQVEHANKHQISIYNYNYIRHCDIIKQSNNNTLVFNLLNIISDPDPFRKPDLDLGFSFMLFKSIFKDFFHAFLNNNFLASWIFSAEDSDMIMNSISEEYSYLNVSPTNNFILPNYNKLLSVRVPININLNNK